MPRSLSAAAFFRAQGAANFPNVQLFTANGTFTPPAGVTLVWVSGTGGGGGGGGGATGNGGQGGGGGAGCWRIPVNVTPGTGVTITVGIGGGGGSSAPTDGGSGGVSSFGSAISLPGGHGGASSAAGSAASNLVAHKDFPAFVHPAISQANADQYLALFAASPQGFYLGGQDGQLGSGTGWGGRGGSSVLSSPVRDGSLNHANPNRSQGWGAGGAGGYSAGSATAGVAGGAGAIIVEW